MTIGLALPSGYNTENPVCRSLLYADMVNLDLPLRINIEVDVLILKSSPYSALLKSKDSLWYGQLQPSSKFCVETERMWVT